MTATLEQTITVPETLEGWVKLAQQVIAENPKRTNPLNEDGSTCRYVKRVTATKVHRCIAGETFHRVGVSDEALKPHEGSGATAVFNAVPELFTVQPDIRNFVRRLQAVADGFIPNLEMNRRPFWGEINVRDDGSVGCT